MTTEGIDNAPAPGLRRTSPDAANVEPAVSAMRDLCPFLLAADGGWRSVDANGQHRCTAVYPPAQLTTEKQRRLCLTPDHASCATFEAALAAREPVAVDRPETARPMPSTTPVVMERSRFALPVRSLRPDKSAGQAALVILLAVAFMGVVVSRPSGPGATSGGAAGPTGTPTAGAATATPLASAALVDASPSPAEASPAPQVTLVPTENTPPPSAVATTYKVKSGDTLSGIAATYGTTWKVIAELNGIKDPTALRVGTVLQLP